MREFARETEMTAMINTQAEPANLPLAMLVDGNSQPGPERRADYEALLANSGCRVTAFASADGLVQAVIREAPDLLVVTCAMADEKLLAAIKNLEEQSPLPVIMISGQNGEALRRAISAGVHAFGVVEPGSEEAPGRLRFFIDTALATFDKVRDIKKERDAAIEALAGRKIIEKAKGLVMIREGVTEDEAYRMLRKTAMDRNRKLIDVARQINGAEKT